MKISQKCKYILALVPFLTLSLPVLSDTITLAPHNPTNADNIVATISGCRDYYSGELKNVNIEIKSNEITIYADMPMSNVGSVSPAVWCYKQEVDIGLLAPGNYNVNYLVSDLSPELQAIVALAVTGVMSIPTNSPFGLLLLVLLILWTIRHGQIKKKHE